MARMTRLESHALTRKKLLASACEVVAREGYEGASIDKIADEAGFSKGAFYSNFASKEEIFLELLELHANQDIVDITGLLENLNDPEQIISTISAWAMKQANDPTWGLLALELFRRARRDATFGERHASLFRAQWTGLGRMLQKLFPEGISPVEPEILGGIIMELTYGAASDFMSGPTVGDLVRAALTAFYKAYGRPV